MKKIFEKKFENSVKLNLNVKDEFIELAGLKIYQEHDQDCCETVYADFSILENYKKQLENYKEISKIEIKSVKDMGFIIFLYKKPYYNGEEAQERIGILINCYNEQNGYYSDNLNIKIFNKKENIFEFESEKCDVII